MAWDFAEAQPVRRRRPASLDAAVELRERSARATRPAVSATRRASRRVGASPIDGALISTDPPYYDNIGYSDLSDFFYVWLRRSLRSVHPDLLSTMLVPKAEELVANPYRHDGKDGAKEFFEDGFRRVFARARETALADFPITVYYAFKQSDAGDDGTASTGWETLLDGMIRSGWAITATWPMRSERGEPDASTSARTPSPPRSSSRCARAPTTRRRPTAAASSPRCTTSCPTRCASSSRARSRRSICRRPRSARGWRCSRATRR